MEAKGTRALGVGEVPPRGTGDRMLGGGRRGRPRRGVALRGWDGRGGHVGCWGHRRWTPAGVDATFGIDVEELLAD
jgi:hypothetical protein